MQSVLNMLGATGEIHLQTRLGDPEFHIQAAYNVPPVEIQIIGKGLSIEEACADVTWQFLEQIGMGPAE